MSTVPQWWWSPTGLEKIITVVLYIGAIQRACDIHLASWIATEEAAPPITVLNIPEVEKKRKTLLAKVMDAVFVAAIFGTIIGFGVIIYTQAGTFPPYAVDYLFGTVMLVLWTQLFYTGLYSIFRRPLQVEKYRRGKSNKWSSRSKVIGPATGIFNWSNPRVNFVISVICSSILLYAVSEKQASVMPVGLGLGVMSLLVRETITVPKTTMKRVLLYSLLPYLAFVAIVGKDLILPSQSSQTKSTDKDIFRMASDGIMSVFSLWIHMFGGSMAGSFLMTNMRYEHSRVRPKMNDRQTRVNPILTVRPSGVLPLHFACIAGAFLLVPAFDIAGWMGYFPGSMTLLAALFASTPVVILTSAVYTLIRGDLKQWWQYTESWETDIDWSITSKVDENGQEGTMTPSEKSPLKA